VMVRPTAIMIDFGHEQRPCVAESGGGHERVGAQLESIAYHGAGKPRRPRAAGAVLVTVRARALTRD
jgi:hypothetical protein